MSLNQILSAFYERDLRSLIGELAAFKNEENIWKTVGSIKNPAGNLALHIIGGSNYLIGNKLANTGYVRNRDQEFAIRNIPRAELIQELEELIILIKDTLARVDMDADFPIQFDDAVRTNSYVLTQLALHLNYHLGQVNYLRRSLE